MAHGGRCHFLWPTTPKTRNRQHEPPLKLAKDYGSDLRFIKNTSQRPDQPSSEMKTSNSTKYEPHNIKPNLKLLLNTSVKQKHKNHKSKHKTVILKLNQQQQRFQEITKGILFGSSRRMRWYNSFK